MSSKSVVASDTLTFYILFASTTFLQKVAFSITAQCLAVIFGNKNKIQDSHTKTLDVKKRLVCHVISSIGNNIAHVFALDVARRVLGEYNCNVIECACSIFSVSACGDYSRHE